MDSSNRLVVIKEGCPVLAEEVEVIIDELQAKAEEAKQQLDNMRAMLLQAMMDNDIYSCKVGKYTISQVIGKDKVEFDKERFLTEADESIVIAFSEIKKSEPFFNVEKFKADHPDLFEQYVESEDIIEVDTKKLEKIMPNVYEKFVTRTKSDKKTTIMIKATKEK